jgi:hypothetical protein
LPFDVFLLAAACVLVFLMLGPVLIIPLHIPINYNEGWNALFDTRAVVPGAGPLYPPADSFVFNNYPPLGFYLVGALGRFVFGDMILAGRVQALISLLSAAALTGLCVRFLGGARRAALAAGLFLLLNMATWFRTYIAMDDPQWLAQAIMLGGLAVLLRNGGLLRLTGGRLPFLAIAGAALLMVAGGFVKHNLIALPLAVTLWLAVYNRRAAALWVLVALLGLALGLGLTALLHGHAAFTDILHHRRVFRARLWAHGFQHIAPLLPMAVVAVIVLLRRLQNSALAGRAAIVFVAQFTLIATVTGILQRLGEGVYYNAQFETLIALCFAFGLALSPVLAAPIQIRGRTIGATSLAVFAALPLICAWPWHLPPAWDEIAGRHARAAAWAPVIARVAAAKGPAGCIIMSVCWWAGKPSEVDVFNLTQSVLAGGPLDRFQAAVANRHFAIFEDDPASFTHLDAFRLWGRDPIMNSFVGRYRRIADGPEGIQLLAPLAR